VRVIELRDGFGIDHLAWVERPDFDKVAAGQVVVRVNAVSLNFRDLMTVQGLYNPKQPLPLIPCSDGVGQVIAVGAGVSRVAVGDRVAGIFAQRWLAGRGDRHVWRTTLGGPSDGMLAEQVQLSEDGLVKIPDHLSYEQAATLPCAAVTAWHALVEVGRIQAGDRVLLLGTGGVSIAALQLAKACGAEVCILSSSDEKLAKARQLGADHTLNYREHPDWDKHLLSIFPDGADQVVEVGGAGTLNKSINAVRLNGTISVIGVLSGVSTEIDLRRILMRGVRLQGVFVGNRDMFEAMNRAISLHKITPVVDRVFAMDESAQAFRYMTKGQHFGKIVIHL